MTEVSTHFKRAGRCYLVAAATALVLPVSFLAVRSLVGDIFVTLLLVGILALLALPFVRGWVRRDLSLLEPVIVVSFLMALAYPLQVIVPFMTGGFSSKALRVLYWEDDALLREALLYVFLGLSAYLVAYYCPSKTLVRLGAIVSLKANPVNWESRILLIALIGWSFRVYLIATGNYQTFYEWSGYDRSTGAILWYFSQLTWFAYILAWVHSLSSPRRKTALATAIGLTLAEGSFQLIISGSKTYLAYLLIFPIMATYLRTRRLPLFPLVGFGLALVLIIFPFVMQMRDIQQNWKAEGSEIWYQLEIAYNVLQNVLSLQTFSDDKSTEALSEFIIHRFGGLEYLAVILTEVPKNHDYLYWHDLMLLPLALVPRILFPWKPESQGVQTYSEQIYQGGGAVSIFPIADGYYNFGITGVILLMASWGLVHRFFYSNFYKPQERHPFAMAVFIYLYFMVTGLDDFIETRYAGLLQQAAILSALYFLLFNLPRLPQDRVDEARHPAEFSGT